MSKDYYNILGVKKEASADEIKAAFRKKAHEHHPDKGGDEAKFKEINEAYQVLGNQSKRQQYDQFGSAFQNGQAGGFGGQGFGGFDGMNINMDDLGDIFGGFGDIFGFGANANRRSRAQRGRDLEMIIKIDFLESILGAEKEINFPHLAVCKHCQGSGHAADAKIETCSTCNGTGHISRIQRTILGAVQTQSIPSRQRPPKRRCPWDSETTRPSGGNARDRSAKQDRSIAVRGKTAARGLSGGGH